MNTIRIEAVKNLIQTGQDFKEKVSLAFDQFLILNKHLTDEERHLFYQEIFVPLGKEMSSIEDLQYLAETLQDEIQEVSQLLTGGVFSV